MTTVEPANGKSIRMRRLFRRPSGNLFIVPMDHSVTNGPVYSAEGMAGLMRDIATNGADAVVLHKGRVGWVESRWFDRLALIVHLSASTAHAPDADAKVLVSNVEESLRLGADAVSVHVNLGSNEESRQIADLATVADACDRWNMPLVAMMYPRGPRIADAHDPELVAHAATLAVDLGADVVKSLYAGSPGAMSEVVRSCPAPIVAAGGPRLGSPDEVLSYVRDVLKSGVRGVAMGRNVFEADAPGQMVRGISALLHG